MSDRDECADYDSKRSQSPSIDSQAYAIPMPAEIVSQLSEGSSDDEVDNSNIEDSNGDMFLDNLVPGASSGLFMDSQDAGPMLDVSKYIFDSLIQAINSADFAEAISLQTKTSAVINARSMKLKQLIDSTKEQLAHFKSRFERGAETSKAMRHNLRQTRETISKINAELGTAYPIELNQAREKVLERQFGESPESQSDP
ncbi:hypothetical protein HG536_0A01420 [Torulaspora globosa]|uniref:Biogenesis of lysosome-related organelles complex 1 subunit KXD1 n=1 Tax=Torulaspora globosa TaxID=48254 RepID=A0A7G3Z9Y9_9SACH|nr:uncharacterized protein HG536_0A01420 [Torulaspora globosa]QLL30325.1 hypothetical protein HG536_0A01420 [Torulaspora globosa]